MTQCAHTIPFRSIWQAPWRVMGLLKILFWHFPKLLWHAQKYGSLAPQARKITIFIISRCLRRWFRHLRKLTMTIMTFRKRKLVCAHDAWPPALNWMKWYSSKKKGLTSGFSNMALQVTPNCKFYFILFQSTSTVPFQIVRLSHVTGPVNVVSSFIRFEGGQGFKCLVTLDKADFNLFQRN